jgi:hypothetical protein
MGQWPSPKHIVARHNPNGNYTPSNSIGRRGPRCSGDFLDRINTVVNTAASTRNASVAIAILRERGFGGILLPIVRNRINPAYRPERIVSMFDGWVDIQPCEATI